MAPIPAPSPYPLPAGAGATAGRLRSARCWSLTGAGGTVDVEVTARDSDTLEEVLPALGRALDRCVDGLWSGSSRLPDDLTLSSWQLRHGAVLGMGRPGPRGLREGRASALELHVVGGPDGGRTSALGQGRHVLGRGGEAGVRLDDPDVSRRHVEVVVGGGTVAVTDLGSTNGTRLGEDDLDGAGRPWHTWVPMRLGASTLAVTGPVGAPLAVEPAGGGRWRVHPSVRLTAPAVEHEVTLPAPPSPPPPRRLAWAAVALPAVGGVTLAVVLDAPTFLFFALLSPVVAIGTWWSDRWSGRRSRRREGAAHAAALLAAETRLAAAVRADVRASEAAQPDLAALTTAAGRRTSPLWGRSAADPDALCVRVGAGPAASRVIRRTHEGSRLPEPAPHLPAVVDLRRGGLAVTGPREHVLGVLRSLVAQIAALHPPDEVRLALWADDDRRAAWGWSRWLPHLDARGVEFLGSDPDERARSDERLRRWLAALEAGRPAGLRDRTEPSGRRRWWVVVVDGTLSSELAAVLARARDAGVVVLTAAASDATVRVDVGAVLQLTGETGNTGRLACAGAPERAGITVDRMPTDVAASLARDLADLVPATTTTALPSEVQLLGLSSGGVAVEPGGGTTGRWTRRRDELVATLGVGVDGAFRVDLCRLGPHMLVAGTTGSGKSELLQTLITALALRHPPDRCSFLLVDYKGGAAFADAAELPHTVGLVTDLDSSTTERALRSLSAELTRREALLKEAGVADIAALPDSVDLARLVIVVDEFATLAEELPTFVPGLVGIAQRGRSLGVHLVLATQRPAGVVSAEIRANCTLRVCLRATDEADSRDVLGTADAAALPVDRPGRAYVRSGSGSPALIQVARVSQPFGIGPPEVPAARVRTWPGRPWTPDGGAQPSGVESDLATAVRALTRRSAADGVAAPHRPWRPPLPRHLPIPQLVGLLGPTGAPCARGQIVVGLVDRPDRQDREPLVLDLDEGGGWLAVGGPRSGRTTFLRTALTEAVRRMGPDLLHVHVVDLGGGALAAEAARLQHTGTAIGAEDPYRIVRLLDRLGQEVSARRAAPAAGRRPAVLLLVDGVEALSTLLDDSDPGRGSTGLLRLVRDGTAVGMTCLLTADRAVPGGRLAAVAAQRLVLPLPDRADYAVAGVPARAVPSTRCPGRAVVGEAAAECQLALPRPGSAADEVGTRHPAGVVPGPWSRAPDDLLRIPELDADPVLPMPSPADVPADGRPRLRVGPGGDEGDVRCVDPWRGGGLLVVGPAGSGRTAAVDAFGLQFAGHGVPVLRLERTNPASGDDGLLRAAAWDTAAVAAWIEELAGRPGVVLADDIGAPSEIAALSCLTGTGAAAGVALVAAGTSGLLTTHYQGPVAALRRARSGLLLCPGPGDADLLGLRLPRLTLPVRPGSGWLVVEGTPTRVQVARRVERG